MSNDEKSQVKEFWNRNVNQFNQLNRDDIGTREFFEAASELRYQYHYHLRPLFDQLSHEFPGGKLLEVGCSMGNETIELAKRGMKVYGIDLTEKSIELIQKRFELYGLQGDFRVGDAENLPFSDNTFDVVYSFGVLHHTPDTQKAIEEVRRVLRPGGKASIMLYNKISLNWLAHMITGVPFDGSKDDPCPVEKAYSKKAAKLFFRHYSSCEIDVDYLFGFGWSKIYDLIPTRTLMFLGRIAGWHLMIEAYK